jgi:hypothetical protein
MKLYEQQVFLFDKVHWQPLFLPYNFWRMVYIMYAISKLIFV